MGLTAFVVFVVPWMLLAVWLFRLPSTIRLGAPSAPWRQLTPSRTWLQEQERRENIRLRLKEYKPNSMSHGGALGSGSEDTEPRE
jgi:hypothetical protein